jgi:DNA repair exonuclease SbcCD ATPase subunit
VIPRSIRLKGFLCYKDEQAVEFDGPSTLWMLSGLNGSGKSAIFDAVTFALFGQHRGGGTQHLELINKDSKNLSVEFDFTLDGQPYRARRTQTRDARGGSKGTQQMLRLDGGEWVPLEDTNLKRDFDSWVEEHIGLSYETFTSSVLLLQGKAESLLGSRPEDRRKVLAQIVDLERYEALHKAADDERKAQELKLKGLSNRLAAIPVVEPLEIAAADNRIAEAEEERERSRAEVERLQGLEHQARAWAELQGRLTQARERCRSAQVLLDDADAIQAAAARLRELREALPLMQTILDQRSAAHQATQKLEELTKTRQKQKEYLALKDDALKQAREKRSATQSRIAAEDARLLDVSARYRQSTERMAKLREYEVQESELNRVRDELKRLPADPAKNIRQARESFDGLTLLSQVAPVLARFAARRDELRRALEQERTAQQNLQAVRARGEKHKAEAAELRPKLEEAERRLFQANEQVTETRTLCQQARSSLQELTSLDGSKVCRHCGQALTPGHLQEEKKRRGAAVTEAERGQRQAADEQKAAKAAEQPLREQLAAADRCYQDARLEYRDSHNQEKQATQEADRLRRECAEAYAELPDSFRKRVAEAPPADWLTTAYPSAAEVQAARAEAGNLPAARARLREAEQLEQRWQSQRTLEDRCQQTLHRLQGELPSDRQEVRREHERLQVDEQAIKKSLEVKRSELKEIDGDVDRLGRDCDQARKQLVDLDGHVQKQELTRQHAQQAQQKAQKQLPPAWLAESERVGLRPLSDWQAEKGKLEAQRAEERDQELRQARLRLDDLKREAAELESAQAGFPEEARQPPEQIKVRLAAARQTDKQCDDELIQSRQQKARLEERRRERDQIGEEYLAAERELASQRLLAELLGKDRLQLHLVRQAERQVVEYANAVLDRLSGGQLYLRLTGAADGEGGSGKALDLEAYNRATGEKAINVAFLSGSQKFRVAVSLALGIGQYASRRHHPIESVIIDEGFGCLDRQGRQVMIQELQNLRGQMRCILLVSHQEEFADAFNDGYHFSLENGATRVERIQR